MIVSFSHQAVTTDITTVQSGQDELVTTDLSSSVDETTTVSQLELDQSTIDSLTTLVADSTDQTTESESTTKQTTNDELPAEPRNPLKEAKVNPKDSAAINGVNKVVANNNTTTETPLTTGNSENEQNEESTTSIATTESADFGPVPTDASGAPLGDEVAAIIPVPVKIYDPSVDVEATTFLAEANMQTESSDVTTESFPLEIDDEEFISTTEASDSLMINGQQVTTESGINESETNSGTEWTSDTTTFSPPSPLPAPFVASGQTSTSTYSTKKRNYKGYKVYRVVLPSEDAVRRIMAMEDEPGIDFWADPRLLLRPRGLFVTSAADVMVAPSIAAQVEQVFRESRLLYSLLVADVQV